MRDYLDDLTEAQREAVLHVEGPLLILAGPGSGKTRVVTHRIAHLLSQGIPDHQVLALTFTNKAAEEMQGRLERLAPGRSVWVGTFHRFCARLLRKYGPMVGLQENYTIYDAADSLQVIHRVMNQLGTGSAGASPEAVARAIGWAKNSLILPEQYHERAGFALGAVVKLAYRAYQARLRASNAVDFDDLLMHVASLLRDNPEMRQTLDGRYRFILVDEYQDTNLAQYAIARAMSIDHPNLAVTGDPDQSIYGWRGANVKNILEFEKDYPEVRVVRLERNYRSTKRILQVAGQLISHNLRRKEKGLYTENGHGEPVRLVTYPNHRDEADDIAAQIAAQVASGRRRPRDFAIFYRTNALSRSFEFALRERGVPYQMINGLEFFRRKEIKDILAYLQLLNNPADKEAMFRAINVPARGIGKTTLQRLDEHSTARDITLLEAARDARRIDSLRARAAAAVAKFVALIDRLTALAGEPIEALLGILLDETGYRAQWQASQSEEDEERLANIEELLTVAREFDERHPEPNALEAFLEETALVSDTDDWQTQADRVTLMTLHASKGLEFPAVFIVAVEEGLLPHDRSRQSPEQLEEERRLMFVGITRAQQELQLSMAQYRDFRGARKLTVPSSFLMELPRGDMMVETRGTGVAIPEGTDCHFEPDYDEVAAEEARPAPSVPRPAPPLQLTTAAQLAGRAAPPPPPPDSFRHGMLVLHPEYGLGRIVALSGSGAGRKATVQFAAGYGRKHFVLSVSPLRPMRA